MKRKILVAGTLGATLLALFFQLALTVEKSAIVSLTPLGSWEWNTSKSTSSPVAQLALPASQISEFNYKWNHLSALQSEEIWSPFYSQSGKYKLIRTGIPNEEDNLELTIYNSVSSQIFKGIVGGMVAMSNDGIHFVSRFITGGPFFFHSIYENPPKFDKATGEHYYSYAFSADGKYFVGAGEQRIELYTSEGTLVWSKLTNADGPKEVRISDDGSVIVMGTMSTALGSGAIPVVGDKRVKDNRWMGKDHAIFITALDRNGNVLSQVALEHPVVYKMELSNGAGEQAAVSYLNFLTILDTRSGTIKWKQTLNKPWGMITSIAFSKENNLVAVAGTADRNTNAAARAVHLFNNQGEKEDSAIIGDNYRMSTIGPRIQFSNDGKFLLVSSPNKRHLLKLETSE